MRRLFALGVAAVLLLASPVVSAAGKQRPSGPTVAPPTIPPASTSDPARARASGPAAGPADAGDVAALVSLGLGGAGLLVLSLLVARKARGPPLARPPKRSFAAGRALGQASHVGSEAEAIARLRAGPAVGRLVAMGAREGHVRVAIARQRGEPCELVSGYLTGLFEEAWASDVVLQHEQCSGKKRATPCEYSVIRGVPPAEAASTRGSASATGRWPQVPGGRA